MCKKGILYNCSLLDVFDLDVFFCTVILRTSWLQAYAKLNTDTTMFPCLTSLEVHEDELLHRMAEEKLGKIKPDSNEKTRPEVSFSDIPGKFFTKETSLC